MVGSYWSYYGASTFGITLLPMLFGVGLLFWNGRSKVGWLLTVVGALFIFAGVIANLHIFFRPVSLFDTIVMLVLLSADSDSSRAAFDHTQNPLTRNQI